MLADYPYVKLLQVLSLATENQPTSTKLSSNLPRLNGWIVYRRTFPRAYLPQAGLLVRTPVAKLRKSYKGCINCISHGSIDCLWTREESSSSSWRFWQNRSLRERRRVIKLACRIGLSRNDWIMTTLLWKRRLSRNICTMKDQWWGRIF